MTAHRLSDTGTLVDVAERRTSGRVLDKFEYNGTWVRTSTAAGQYKIWHPKIAFKKGHLYWVVGAITLTCPENKSMEMVVWRSGANVEVQKVKVGGGRDSSDMLTNFSVYVNAMFVPDADIEEELWVVLNAPDDSKSMDTDWRKELMPGGQVRHNMYLLDCGPVDVPVPDRVGGKWLDNAGALTDMAAPSEVLLANYTSSANVAGSAGSQTNIMSANWTAKPGHQYLVIACFTAVHKSDNHETRDYWLFDNTHSANPSRTLIGTFGGPSHNKPQQRPVTLVAVLDGSNSAAIYGNRAAGDGDWLTMNTDHRLLVIDLGAKT